MTSQSSKIPTPIKLSLKLNNVYVFCVKTSRSFSSLGGCCYEKAWSYSRLGDCCFGDSNIMFGLVTKCSVQQSYNNMGVHVRVFGVCVSFLFLFGAESELFLHPVPVSRVWIWLWRAMMCPAWLFEDWFVACMWAWCETIVDGAKQVRPSYSLVHPSSAQPSRTQCGDAVCWRRCCWGQERIERDLGAARPPQLDY